MLRHWLEMEPLPDDATSVKRVEVLKRGLRHAPLVVVLHNCYQYNTFLKPTLKKQLNKFIDSVLTGSTTTPSDDMMKLRTYVTCIINALAQHTSCSDLRVREWATTSRMLLQDDEFWKLLMDHATCFDEEQTRTLIRMCLDYTVSECLKVKVYIMPQW